MKKSIFCITFLLILCLCETACGDSSDNENRTSSTAISGEAVSENKQSTSIIPTEMTLKTPYYFSDAIFTIKESNSQEYRADVSLCAELDDVGDQPGIHWELYLELADEIMEIFGATIVSHEGTHYIIRGDTPKHSPDDGLTEDATELKISFE